MSILKLTAIVLLIGGGFVGCTKKVSGDTSFKEANKAFEKQLTRAQRENAIKNLQKETAQ